MPTQEKTETFRERLDGLKTLRDEVRVRVHLGGLEARDALDKAEVSLTQLEQRALHASESALEDLSQSLEKLAASFRQIKARLEQPH